MEEKQIDYPSSAYWEDRYFREDLPWEARGPSPELVATFPLLELKGSLSLDIGCGSGKDAVWLAQQGLYVTGLDLSPTAIKKAEHRACCNSTDNVEFIRADFFQEELFAPQTFAFLFDRGCFHCISPSSRKAFVERAAALLLPEGYWLTLCGNRDDDSMQTHHAGYLCNVSENIQIYGATEARTIRRPGPPKLRAIDIVQAVEGHFEVLSLRRFRFEERTKLAPLGWACLMQVRKPEGMSDI